MSWNVRVRQVGATGVLLMLLALLPATSAGAPISMTEEGGGVVFTFGSGWSTGPLAASTLEAHGLKGTFYVASALLRQGPWYTAYMSAEEVASLSARGHDVGSMTVTMPDLTSVDDARLSSELMDSRAALASLTGRVVDHVAYPYGAVDARVAAATEGAYASGRVVTSTLGSFTASADPYRLPAIMMTSATSLATAKTYVDHAIANDLVIVLAFERITTTPGVYDWRPADLDALAAYVASKGVRVPTVAELVTGSPAPPTNEPRGTIVFTFDDGSVTHVGAAETLAARGFRGTFYIVSDCPRSEADTEHCMTSAQVVGLSRAGHDIQSHTVRHRDLASLSTKRLTSELVDSKNTLSSLVGRPMEHIAYPYGSHNALVRAKAAESYQTGRIFLSNPAPADLPALLAQSGADPMVVPGIGVTGATSLARAKAYVDYAASVNVVIVLAFHDITSPGFDEFSWSPADFAALVDHVKARGIPVKTMAQAY